MIMPKCIRIGELVITTDSVIRHDAALVYQSGVKRGLCLGRQMALDAIKDSCSSAKYRQLSALINDAKPSHVSQLSHQS